jgi:predicted transcriptional regulator
MDKPKAGSFSAFMEEDLKQQRRQPGGARGSAIGLLGILLQREDRELPISELMSQSGMGFVEFSEALKSLTAAGMIGLSGGAGEEVAALTPKGEEVALLSKA